MKSPDRGYFGGMARTGGPGVLGELAELAITALDEAATGEHIIALARETTGAEHAALSVIDDDGRFDTAASSGAVALSVDALQESLAEGPSLDACADLRSVLCNNLLADDRWPRWGARAAALGISSVLTVPMSPAPTGGALSIYAEAPDTFTAEHVRFVEAIAQHAAPALAHISDVRELHGRLDGRTLVGQAQGVVMERLGLDAESALELLVRYASDRGQTLRSTASSVVWGSTTGGRAGRHPATVVYHDELVEIRRSDSSISARGEIDLSNAAAWREALAELVDGDGIVDVDLTELRFIDLAGARELVRHALTLEPRRVRVHLRRASPLHRMATLCGWDRLESLVWEIVG
jgi:anti-anti-sigma factor